MNLSSQSIDRYHILEQLGQGGMATVYKAYDTRLEREVAIKVIRMDMFPAVVLERVLKRFEREAKSLARMTHASIIKVHDYGEYKSAPYLVMELLPGGTLKQRLGKPIPYQEAARLLLPVARALEYAHQRGILHRDVKPSNILITESGEPVLTDFGIAKLLEDNDGQTLTGTGIGVGTPEYMAPEQGLGKEVDGRADIYSLGVVFYELVTGQKPYTADTPLAVLLKQFNDPLPRPREIVKDLPVEAERVILKALAKKAEDRYESMSAFAGALEKLAQDVVGEVTYNKPAAIGISELHKPIESTSPVQRQRPVIPANGQETRDDLVTSRTHTHRPEKQTTEEKHEREDKHHRPLRWWVAAGLVGIILAVIWFIGEVNASRERSLSLLHTQEAAATAVAENILQTETAQSQVSVDITETRTLSLPVPTQTAVIEKTIDVENIHQVKEIARNSMEIPQNKWDWFLSPSGNLIQNSIYWGELIDVRTGQLIFALPEYTYGFIVSPNDRYAYANFWSDQSNSVRIYEISTRELVGEIGGDWRGRSNDDSLLALETFDGSSYRLVIIDTNTIEQQEIWTGKDKIERVTFSNDGEMIAIKAEQQVHIVRNGEIIQTINVGNYSNFAFSFDNTAIAGTVQSGARIWDIATGAELQRFIGTSDNASFSFSSTGPYVAFNLSFEGNQNSFSVIFDYRREDTICQLEASWTYLKSIPLTSLFAYRSSRDEYTRIIDPSKGCKEVFKLLYPSVVPISSRLIANGDEYDSTKESYWSFYNTENWQAEFSINLPDHFLAVPAGNTELIFLPYRSPGDVIVYGLE